MSVIVQTKPKIKKSLPYILIIAGILGCLASFALTYDKIQVLKNPAYVPSCNLNPIFSCGSVMKTEQASLLGVPNTIFGLIGFSALATFGLVLAADAVIKKWLWLVAQSTSVVGLVFMHYLFFQGVFRINAICPWCFLVWMITIPVFLYITAYNLQENNISVPRKLKPLASFFINHRLDILIGWYVIILGILLQHFWYYWKTLL